jgi:hypothetical protein
MPNQPQAFPPAEFKRDIFDGEEFARTETGRGVERRGILDQIFLPKSVGHSQSE